MRRRGAPRRAERPGEWIDRPSRGEAIDRRRGRGLARSPPACLRGSRRALLLLFAALDVAGDAPRDGTYRGAGPPASPRYGGNARTG